MTNAEFAPKQRDKSARAVYYGAVWRVAVVGALVTCVVFVGALLLLKFLSPNPPGDMPPWVLWIVLGGMNWTQRAVEARGQNALRQAGLLVEEEFTIERSAYAAPGGPTLEIRSNPASRRAIIVSCLFLCAALLGVSLLNADSRPFRFLCLLAALIMGGIAVAVWRNVRHPEARLNDAGISVWSAGLFEKTVPWSAIARARLQRSGGVPPLKTFRFLDSEVTETLSLEDRAGKSLLTFSSGNLVGSPAAKARFIAEIVRRLQAATPTALEGNLDE